MHNELTRDEESVILHKGTEQPFTGIYESHWEDGIYTCKGCGVPLYRSKDKFDARCGWPSFDDEIKGAIKRATDRDGERIEITCENCGGHLGHVFFGELFTKKNVRHCVNSISLTFIPGKEEKQNKRAIFAGGCFWGTEYFFQRANGVISTSVGYVGGHKDNPAYDEVCYGDTGHAEGVEVVYDPEVTSYEELAVLFFEIHDPTQIDRQGPDIGKQYRSEIFYLNAEQKVIAERLLDKLMENGYKAVTKVTEARQFWEGEDYHQDYYNKNGNSPYCHVYAKRF